MLGKTWKTPSDAELPFNSNWAKGRYLKQSVELCGTKIF